VKPALETTLTAAAPPPRRHVADTLIALIDMEEPAGHHPAHDVFKDVHPESVDGELDAAVLEAAITYQSTGVQLQQVR